MPKHVRRPSVKHAKTCQDTICQTCLSKPASNMSVDHLKKDQKLVNRTCSSVPVDRQRSPTISYSTGQLHPQAVDFKGTVRRQEVCNQARPVIAPAWQQSMLECKKVGFTNSVESTGPRYLLDFSVPANSSISSSSNSSTGASIKVF